jgi:copper chaperone CopZ
MCEALPLRGTALDAQKGHSFSWSICNLSAEKGMVFTMKKTFKLENLGCANCAAKMESKIKKLNGVDSVNVNFMSSRLTLEAEDGRFEDIVSQAAEIVGKIESGCVLVS